MAIGDIHTFEDGYSFQETLHGPNVERRCVDCGERAHATPDCAEPRCQVCLVRLHGAKSAVERVIGEGKRLPAQGPGAAGEMNQEARRAWLKKFEETMVVKDKKEKQGWAPS